MDKTATMVKRNVNARLPECDYPDNLIYRVYQCRYSRLIKSSDRHMLPSITDDMRTRMISAVNDLDTVSCSIMLSRYGAYASMDFISAKVGYSKDQVSRIIRSLIDFLGKYYSDWVVTGESAIFPISREQRISGRIDDIDFQTIKILYDAHLYTLDDILAAYNAVGGKSTRNVLMEVKGIGSTRYLHIVQELFDLKLIDRPVKTWQKSSPISRRRYSSASELR